MFSKLSTDLVVAVRSLRRSPSLSAGVILTLSISIAALVTTYAIACSSILNELPFVNPAELVWLGTMAPSERVARLSYPEAQRAAALGAVFVSVAPFERRTALMQAPGVDPRRIAIARVSGEFFSTLGAHATMGRLVSPTDDEIGGAPSAVISAHCWVQYFGARTDALGQYVRLDGKSYKIVGIIADSLRFPDRLVDAWIPLRPEIAPVLHIDGVGFLEAVARLRAGVSLTQARLALETVRRPITDSSLGTRTVVISAHDRVYGELSHVLAVVAIGSLILLIQTILAASALLVTRAIAHSGQTAVRLALGASALDLARLEALRAGMLASGGLFVGLWFAYLVLLVIPRLAPAALPSASLFGHGQMLAATAGLLGITIVGLAVLPVYVAAHGSPGRALKEGGSQATLSRRALGTLRLCMALSTAVSVLLLSAAVRAGTHLVSLSRIDLGFSPDGVTTARITRPLSIVMPSDLARLRAFTLAVRDQVATLDSRTAVALAASLPVSGSNFRAPIRIAAGPEVAAEFSFVTSQYFHVLRIPLSEGSTFSEREEREGAPVAIINTTLARLVAQGASPVGRWIRWPGIGDSLKVVGVSAGTRQLGPNVPPPPQVFVSLAFIPLPDMRMFARTERPSRESGEFIRQIIKSVDPVQSVAELGPLRAVANGEADTTRAYEGMAVLFGMTACAIALIGIYVAAVLVAMARKRECALRMALGASQWHIALLLLRWTLATVATGIAAGWWLTLLSGPIVARVLQEPDHRHASIASLTAAMFLCAAAVACLSPMRRLSRLNLTEILIA